MDRKGLKQAFGVLLEKLPGHGPAAEDLEAWSERLVEAWADELLGGEAMDLAAALGETLSLGTRRQEVCLANIRFTLVCPHHLTLAIGEASIRYWPRAKVAGPSGLVRLVDAATRRRVLQEEAVEMIADTLERTLEPRGLEVELISEQTCVSCRGVRRQGTSFATRVRRGLVDD